MKTKSLLFTLAALLILCAANSYAANIYGPFWITKSNEPLLPDANYASVYINDDYPIAASPDPYHYLVTVTPNTSILVPGSNYGIQHFGLNYKGNPYALNVFVLTTSDTIDSKWGIDINAPSSFGPFGVFVYDGDTTGKNRRNPLRIYIGSNTPLTYTDFYAANEDLYMFACHIAGFNDMDPGSKELTSALFALPIPVVIELSSFTAKAGDGQVTINWETAAEIDNAGFNIYRSETESGAYVPINGPIISAEGSPSQSTTYDFIDNNVQNGKTYYYKLEDIDIYGVSTFHGPVSANLQEIQVSVDIKPGACPNTIGKAGKNAVMPFAIMGTVAGFDMMGTVEDFDISQIDPESIRITREGVPGEVKPIRWNYSDVATPFEGDLCDCHSEKGDGYMDLSMKVYVNDVVEVLRLQEVVDDTIPLTIIGKLKDEFGGTPIRGQDCVKVLKSVLK